MAIRFTNGSGATMLRGQPIVVDITGSAVLAGPDDVVTGLVRHATVAAAARGDAVAFDAMSALTTDWNAVTGSTGGLVVGAQYAVSGVGTISPNGTGAVVGHALSTERMLVRIAERSSEDEIADLLERATRTEDALAGLIMWMLGQGFEIPKETMEALEELQ